MTAAQRDVLRDRVCRTCWATRTYEEAGVIADAGSGWLLLLTDDHHSKCDPPKSGRESGHADCVAVRPQETEQRLRVIELKQKGEPSSEISLKFEKTASVLRTLLPDAPIEPELHVRPAPESTVRVAVGATIDGERVAVPIFAGGRRLASPDTVNNPRRPRKRRP